ncbi:MAG: hypothetical protein OEZ02_15085, partial [Anaerolineae bacterium]|nr:hypothetical protein [Anaerolineae bacterium]
PGSKTAPDGSAWAAAAYSLYYRVTDVDVDRKWHFFELSGGLYAVDQRADGGSSSVYMNGERGVATAGSSTTLTDSNAGVSASWATDQWAGWHIKITNGIGKGQWRRIISNTGTVITVERAWDINPAATPLPSQYVIYGGDSWQDISPTSGDLIDGVVLGLTIFDNIAAFAQGTTTSDPPILKMRWYASATPTPRHQFDDDGTNKADLLHMHYTPGEGAKIWRINNTFGTGSSATSEDWGTDLTFDGGIPLGDKNYPVTNLLIHDDKPFIFKVSGIHTILNHRLMNVNLGMGFIKSENNGEAAISHKSHLYFSWGDFALQRLVGRDVVSIGPASGSGLPDERRGKIAALASHPTGLFAVIDAEARISSVMVRDDDRQGWHEIFRSWAAGKRAQNLYWQTTPGTRPRLWINVGGEMVYQEWPQSTFNPLEDGGMAYQHECAIVMADIDLGVARLPKFFKEMTLLSENLSPGVELNLEYQLDKDIGSAVWTQVGSFYQSPEDTLQINRGNTRKIRLRLRLLTDEAATPPVYIASVLEGFARTPVKYQWNIRVRVADNQLTNSGGRDHDPDKFANWLKQAAQQAKRVRMRAIWEQMDDRYVIVEPPNLFRQFTNKILGWWGGSMSLTIREA